MLAHAAGSVEGIAYLYLRDEKRVAYLKKRVARISLLFSQKR